MSWLAGSSPAKKRLNSFRKRLLLASGKRAKAELSRFPNFYVVKNWQKALEYIAHINNPTPERLFSLAVKHIESIYIDIEKQIKEKVDESLFFVLDFHKEIIGSEVLGWRLGELSLTVSTPEKLVVSSPLYVDCEVEVANSIIVRCPEDGDDVNLGHNESILASVELEGSVEFEFSFDEARLEFAWTDISLPKQTEINIDDEID